MSMKLIDTAPRGKVFAVVHLSHVAGPGMRVLEAGRFALHTDAQRAADRIDGRLNAAVVLAAREDRNPMHRSQP